MKHLIFPGLFMLFTLHAFAQTRCDCYDRLLNLGMSYEERYQFQKAIEVFKDALNFMEESNDDVEIFQGLARCYDTLANYDSSVVYAMKAIDKGLGAGYFYSYTPKTFEFLPNDERLLWPRPGQEVNWGLFKLTQQMFGADQYFRTTENFESQWLPDSLEQYKMPIILSLFHLADSNNYVLQMKIFRKFGWPSYNKVGFFNAMDVRGLMHNVRYPGFGRHLLDTLYVFGRNCEGIRTSKVLKLEDNRIFHGGDLVKGSGKNLIGFSGADRYNRIYNLKNADSIRLAYNMLRLKEDVPPGETLPKDYKPIPYPKNYFCLKKYQLQ
ncbi:MAG TPA: tetratricopeptide repeat protein [Flavipsychrobacter sp.]|nr:tetratricopeptide repeat protein [Flavipsychrobacter sp.]